MYANKLGLSWAKLSSSRNWTLTVCRFGLSRFGLKVMIGLIFLGNKLGLSWAKLSSSLELGFTSTNLHQIDEQESFIVPC